MMPLRLVLLTLAFVLFLVAAWLSTALAERMKCLAFAAVVLAWIVV